MDQFWHITFPLPGGDTYSLDAPDEMSARALAASESRSHTHATVTNRKGHVATYVNGAEWQPTSSNA